MSGYEHKKRDSDLQTALYWLTLIELGIAEPADAKLFLDSMEDHWLPTEEDIERARKQFE